MADDFMELVYKLWEGAWEPDALERDKAGRFADPAKVHRIDHDGPYFRSHGYGNTSYSPQGTPVLFQAGSSPAGRAFGGRHAEAAFLGGGSAAVQAEQVAGDPRRGREGRAPPRRREGDDVVRLRGRADAGGGRRQARGDPRVAEPGRRRGVVRHVHRAGPLVVRPGHPDDRPADRAVADPADAVRRQTVGQVLRDWATHGVGAAPFVGSAEDVADHLCALAEEADLDGILLHPQVQPSSTIDFIELVLPILRDRGVAPVDGEPATLRQRLLGQADPTLADDHPGAGAPRHASVTPVARDVGLSRVGCS